jgi:hypothetical protein
MNEKSYMLHLQLHDSGYNHGKALDALAKCPAPDGIDKKWSEEETVIVTHIELPVWSTMWLFFRNVL